MPKCEILHDSFSPRILRGELTNRISSDGPTPEKQAEQIMAIYPVLKGQKSTSTNFIPPRGLNSGANVQSQPVEQQNDLIDFGQNNDCPPAVQKPAEPAPGPQPEIDPHHKSTAEIQTMLSATGSPILPEGSLIDFHEDLKKDLPQNGNIKRGDTEESHDEFVDALE